MILRNVSFQNVQSTKKITSKSKTNNETDSGLSPRDLKIFKTHLMKDLELIYTLYQSRWNVRSKRKIQMQLMNKRRLYKKDIGIQTEKAYRDFLITLLHGFERGR